MAFHHFHHNLRLPSATKIIQGREGFWRAAESCTLCVVTRGIRFKNRFAVVQETSTELKSGLDFLRKASIAVCNPEVRLRPWFGDSSPQ